MINGRVLLESFLTAAATVLILVAGILAFGSLLYILITFKPLIAGVIVTILAIAAITWTNYYDKTH